MFRKVALDNGWGLKIVEEEGTLQTDFERAPHVVINVKTNTEMIINLSILIQGKEQGPVKLP